MRVLGGALLAIGIALACVVLFSEERLASGLAQTVEPGVLAAGESPEPLRAPDAAQEVDPLRGGESTAEVPGGVATERAVGTLQMSWAETRKVNFTLVRPPGCSPTELVELTATMFRVGLLARVAFPPGNRLELELPVHHEWITIELHADHMHLPALRIFKSSERTHILRPAAAACLNVDLGGEFEGHYRIECRRQGGDASFLRALGPGWNSSKRPDRPDQQRTSESPGVALFRGLLPGRYQVLLRPGKADLEGRSAGSHERWVDLEPHGCHRLVCHTKRDPMSVHLTGKVLCSGVPVVGAELLLDMRQAKVGAGEVSLVTDAHGGFAMDLAGRGEAKVCIKIAGLPDQEETIEIDDRARQMRNLLIKGNVLAGRLTDLQEGPVPGVSVRLTAGEGGPIRLRSGEDGLFRFHGIPSGTVQLEVAGPSPDGVPIGGQYGLVERELFLPEGLLDVGDVQLGGANGALAGVVIDKDEQPLSWARVYLRTEGEDDSAWEWAASSRYDGYFEIRGLSPQTVELFVLHDDPDGPGAIQRGSLLATPTPVDADQQTPGSPVRIQLVPAGRIAVRFLPENPDGAPRGIEGSSLQDLVTGIQDTPKPGQVAMHPNTIALLDHRGCPVLGTSFDGKRNRSGPLLPGKYELVMSFGENELRHDFQARSGEESKLDLVYVDDPPRLIEKN